jgi:hypothetical protein
MLAGNHDDHDETSLYVFHASDLFGPWQPHVLNLAKCDLRSARPAGPLSEHGASCTAPLRIARHRTQGRLPA